MELGSAIAAEWRLRRNKQIYCEWANPKQSGCLFFTYTLSLLLGLLINSLNLALRTERAKLPKEFMELITLKVHQTPSLKLYYATTHSQTLFVLRSPSGPGSRKYRPLRNYTAKLGKLLSAGCTAICFFTKEFYPGAFLLYYCIKHWYTVCIQKQTHKH